jgi:hypothetical protein
MPEVLFLLPAALAVLLLRAALRAAERRGWIRLHGRGAGTLTAGLGAVDELLSPHRHEVQVQRRHDEGMPAPADSGDPPLPSPS